MWRLICGTTLAVALCAGQTVSAQGPPKGDVIKKLQADLKKIQGDIESIQMRLTAATSKGPGSSPLEKKGFGKGPGSFPSKKGFGMGPGFAKKGTPPLAKKGIGKGPGMSAWAQMGTGHGWSGRGPHHRGSFGGPPWMRAGLGKGWGPWAKKGDGPKFGPPFISKKAGSSRSDSSPSASDAEVRAALDRLTREIEELRKKLGRR